MSDVLGTFHPLVARWFPERFGAPTAAQARLAAIARGRGHADRRADRVRQDARGVPVRRSNALVRDGGAHGLRDETSVVYVSPLKAL